MFIFNHRNSFDPLMAARLVNASAMWPGQPSPEPAPSNRRER